jgi:hypothetical protein
VLLAVKPGDKTGADGRRSLLRKVPRSHLVSGATVPPFPPFCGVRFVNSTLFRNCGLGRLAYLRTSNVGYARVVSGVNSPGLPTLFKKSVASRDYSKVTLPRVLHLFPFRTQK